ncbi:hypothetical protein BDV39DRAFT_193716 [Aspergillus sergii]|uniref:Aminoglycoside phosphotransferase domain-containing protein n=1 Tax=Aspergillus sergii TaxID=1034303 RepID=A0A5N6X039_9EURO|nr:hypothetical protein BDV39DRAFT_193716 [Aspergillus sergii]
MAEETEWVSRVNMARVDGHGGFLNGSYNVGQRLVIDDGTTWLLRLPRASSVSPEYADEKIAMEVEALHVIREKMPLPVPDVYAWGLARENQLGLGPFILMNFIMVSALARIDFSQIEACQPWKKKFPAPGCPLTWKAHEMLRVGGVDTFDNGFSTTREYFEYVISQDWQYWSLIPDLTNTTYDRRHFKLICDDFGLGNVIVRSKDGLTITGVVDMEWVYAGPAQPFGSAPWWFLMDRPVNEEWDFEENDAPEATDRYFRYLEILYGNPRSWFNGVRILAPCGSICFCQAAFFDTPTFPCMQLRKFRGAEWWDERLKENSDTEEVETFVASKLEDLAAYDKIKDKVEHFKALMDSKEITTIDFISSIYSLLRYDQEMWSG